jgi:general stress protein 26
MTRHQPVTELDQRYSSEGALALPWRDASAMLESAEIYWLTTIRPENRPHTTPLIGAFFDGAFFFYTGKGERKQMNLEANKAVVVTTGCNSYHGGIDIVLEGDAELTTDAAIFAKIAEHYRRKYDWDFAPDENAEVYRVAPVTAFAFGKGEPFSQTRYRFQPPS